MAGVTEAQVLDALRTVIDEDRHQDIVALNMISGLAVRDGHVDVSIEVDPKEGARLEPLRQAAEAAVNGLPGVLTVTAILTAHHPLDGSTQSQSHRLRQPVAQSRTGKLIMPGVEAIVAVSSGKGGVGKSTTAVNLALGLAANGLRVGLLDADIYGPSIPFMTGIHGRPEMGGDQKLKPKKNYGIQVMSMGFLVPQDTPMIWRGPMVQTAILQMLRDVTWGELDIIIVDMPPGTGDAQLTMAQQVPLAGAVIVSTPQDIALLDARKGLNMFRRVEVPVLGIIENMSYFHCPNCGHQTDIFGHGGARREAESLDTEFLGEIPLDTLIRETSDGGSPIVVSHPDSAYAGIYRSIASRIWEKITQEGKEAARSMPPIIIQ